ncbi:DoxX family protein [Streptomyces boncukensis]|uniref:DoxX family protein n=1 Tax=Streptomyces boncukensis TaxID=2711219 RepID=A0A6G4X853_9ACTN|nr:DoxX family protein [Streptomyces boncukensis]NGO73322.1 DoxX family protein [Streptomyces boncukensis]
MTPPEITLGNHTSTHRTRGTTPQALNTEQTGRDIALLLLRLAVGLSLAGHGVQKLFGWFDGSGLDGTGQFFTSIGYPAGRTMAVVAGLSEALGGLGLALGLLTPLAGAAVVGTMINVVVVTRGDGFMAPEGVEYAVVLAVAAAAVCLAGPGRYAVDRLLPVLRTHRLSHGLAALALACVTAAAVLLTRT